MPDQASESRHVRRLDAQLDQLRTQFRRQQVLVAYGLVLASLRVPVVSFVNSPGSIESERETEHLFGAIGEYFGGDLDIGSRSTYPYAIPGGLSLTRIGLVVVLVGLVAVAVTCWPRLDELTGKRLALLTAAAIVPLFGVALVWLGQGWLPNDDLGTHAAWGLLVVAGGGIWQLQALRR